MTTKYGVQIFKIKDWGRFDNYSYYDREYSSTYFCREFGQNELEDQLGESYLRWMPTVIRLIGYNMRDRTWEEQKGMAKFAKIMFPERNTFADATSIWIESTPSPDFSFYWYPRKEMFSLTWFFLKYMAIPMQANVTRENLPRRFITRKHQCFSYAPDQQLGTAFYVWAYLEQKQKLYEFQAQVSSGNGPGTAMRALANEDEQSINGQSDASYFYSKILGDWLYEFPNEIRTMMDYHCPRYARFEYMPLLFQDIYKRLYNGDGYFDGIEYGDDEW